MYIAKGFSVLTLIACMVTLVSCRSREQKVSTILDSWLNKEILIPSDLVFTLYGIDTVDYSPLIGNYKILMYIDTIGCTSCQLQLERWIEWIDHLKRKSPYVISYLFDFYPKDLKEIKDLLAFHKFPTPVVIDEDDRLNQLNKFPQGSKFHTFLLDENNRVVLLGNPVDNEQIANLYEEVLLPKDIASASFTKIEVEQDEINLQKVSKENINAMFLLKNTGSNKLIITHLNTSCGCTSVEYTREPLDPGKSIPIKVNVKKKEKGYFSETITIYCNAPESPLSLKLCGNAI